MAVLAYIGLGSNLGDRRAALETAIRRLHPRRVSSIAETAPWGRVDQPAFLNAVAEIETDVGPHELLDRLQGFELEGGRVRSEHWGPRTLDLDLLLYGDRTVQGDNLVVPHRHLAERRFVLEGLAELCPDLPVPGLGRTVRELLDACPDAARGACPEPGRGACPEPGRGARP